jgi:hypothetical protein
MLRIIDIQNPKNPFEVGYIDTQAKDVYVTGPYIFTAEAENGIGIYENLVLGANEDNPPALGFEVSSLLNKLGFRVQGRAELTVYSSNGKKILTETVEGKGIWIPSSYLPDGCYFARFSDGINTAVTKVVVVR